MSAYRQAPVDAQLIWQGDVYIGTTGEQKKHTHRVVYFIQKDRFVFEVLEHDSLGAERWEEYHRDETIKGTLAMLLSGVIRGKLQLPSIKV